MKQLKTKVVIIGAGPAGMAMALYLKRANVDFVLLEKGAPGGKLNNIANVTNYLGIKSIDGPSLAFNMFEQITGFGINIVNEEAFNISKENNVFVVNTSDSIISSSYVVLAIGMNMKKITIDGYDKLKNKGISSCAICDGYLYKNKAIAVVGSNEIAHKEFDYLKKLTDEIYFIDNKEEVVSEFAGESRLEKIITNKKTYNVSGCFIYLDEIINQSLIKELNIIINHSHIKVNNNFMSDEKNVFAIGDACDKSIYQIVGAINDASVVSVYILNSIKNERN